VQQLLGLREQLQELSPPKTDEHREVINLFYRLAKEVALWSLPEEIDALLRSIKERRDALLSLPRQGLDKAPQQN
jgi:hypothetical protein